jgi:hypothetical protein
MISALWLSAIHSAQLGQHYESEQTIEAPVMLAMTFE